ncbi:MAG: hypothetical protein ACLGHG_06025 [Gammaproteobacteria bacterium]
MEVGWRLCGRRRALDGRQDDGQDLCCCERLVIQWLMVPEVILGTEINDGHDRVMVVRLHEVCVGAEMDVGVAIVRIAGVQVQPVDLPGQQQGKQCEQGNVGARLPGELFHVGLYLTSEQYMLSSGGGSVQADAKRVCREKKPRHPGCSPHADAAIK